MLLLNYIWKTDIVLFTALFILQLPLLLILDVMILPPLQYIQYYTPEVVSNSAVNEVVKIS